MSDHYDKIIEDAEEKLRKQEEEANHTRRFINQVLEFAGREPRFNLEDFLSHGSTGKPQSKAAIVRNEYYGKPLAYCVRDFLQRRGGPVKEATLDEIFSALEQGNYDLKKSGSDKDTQRRGVAISLAKNTKTFHKLPNGDFGLAEWYESIRKEKKPGKNGGNTGDASDPQDDQQDNWDEDEEGEDSLGADNTDQETPSSETAHGKEEEEDPQLS